MRRLGRPAGRGELGARERGTGGWELDYISPGDSCSQVQGSSAEFSVKAVSSEHAVPSRRGSKHHCGGVSSHYRNSNSSEHFVFCFVFEALTL